MKKFFSLFILVASTISLSGCNKHTHSFGNFIIDKEPTCELTGERHQICEKCGYFHKEEIPALGHDLIHHNGKSPTYMEEGYLPYDTCSRCDYSSFEKIDRLSLSLKEKEYLSELPSFYITVNGQEIPDRSDPNYHDYLDCSFVFNSSEETFVDNEGKIRIRGTSSRWFKKKGYKIKFSTKRSVYGLSASKKYNLIASYLDPTLLRDYLALSISYDMNYFSHHWAPQIKPIRIYLDSVYQGIYYFVDDIGGKETKIDLQESEDPNKTSFILEMDTLAHNDEERYFTLGTTDVFSYDGSGYANLEYKLDSPEEMSDTQFQFVEDFMTSCRNDLVNQDLESFKNKVDIDSFIDFFLLAELFHNTDLAGRSTYMYLKDVNEKLIFGPSWDFDYTCSRPYQLAPNQDFSLENAIDRFTNYDWWKLFLEIDGTEVLIKQRYSYYFLPIFEYELNEAKKYFIFYEDLILENGNIWYSEINNVEELIANNFSWTFSYFDLRIKFYNSLFLIKK